MLALAALLVCSACANQPATPSASLEAPENQQFSSIRWDDVVSARSVARVSNGSFISLR
jgi:outer membrane lipoprotein SlyB